MENLDPDKGRDLPQGQGSANMHSGNYKIIHHLRAEELQKASRFGQRNY